MPGLQVRRTAACRTGHAEGRLHALPAPVEDPVVIVVAGEALDPQLLEQSREAVVGEPSPLTAQIHQGAVPGAEASIDAPILASATAQGSGGVAIRDGPSRDGPSRGPRPLAMLHVAIDTESVDHAMGHYDESTGRVL